MWRLLTLFVLWGFGPGGLLSSGYYVNEGYFSTIGSIVIWKYKHIISINCANFYKCLKTFLWHTLFLAPAWSSTL